MILTEEDIELAVEVRMDRLDSQYGKGLMATEQYERACKEIYDWADNQYTSLP